MTTKTSTSFVRERSGTLFSPSSSLARNLILLEDDLCSKFRRRRAADNGELKQPRQRRQQKPHKFAYLTMKNSIFARFARAFFIFWHFEDVLVLSTTWNDLFCSCVDDVSIWWQMFNFVFLCSKRWFQFNSRIVRTHFSRIMSLNNWEMIAETRSYIFRWRSRFRRRGFLSSLMSFPPAWDVTDNYACGLRPSKRTLSRSWVESPPFLPFSIPRNSLAKDR